MSTPQLSIWDEINREWSWLTTTQATCRTIEQWSHSWPIFAAARTGNDVLHIVSTNPQPAIAALLTEHRRGTELAGRILMQSMLGKLIKIAGYARTAPFEMSTHLYCERAQLTLNAFSEAMHKVSLSSENLAAALSLKTLGAITATRTTVETVALTEKVQTRVEAVPTECDTDEHQGRALLAWARDNHVLNSGEIDTLTQIYLTDLNSGIKDAAMSLGITYATARQRSHRAINKLREAVTTAIHDGTFFPETSTVHLMSA